MPSGLLVNAQGTGGEYVPALSTKMPLVVQRYPRFTLSLQSHTSYFDSFFFEADERGVTRTGSNDYWDLNTQQPWNRNNVVAWTHHYIPRVVHHLFMRPTTDNKSVCMMDIDKNYRQDPPNTILKLLTSPGTDVSIIEVGSVNLSTIPSRFFEAIVYNEGSFYDSTGTVAFSTDAVKYALRPILYDETGETIYNGVREITTLNGDNQYIDIHPMYDMSKVYVSVMGAYCNSYNQMFGVSFKYVGNRIWFKYYNRDTGRNSVQRYTDFMPKWDLYNKPLITYQPKIFIGYFPNFL